MLTQVVLEEEAVKQVSVCSVLKVSLR